MPRPVTEHDKATQWGAWKDLSGDLIVENNVHSIDVLNWFLNGHRLRRCDAAEARGLARSQLRGLRKS